MKKAKDERWEILCKRTNDPKLSWLERKLVEYSIHDVPAEIEAELDGAYQRCPGCGEIIQINLKTRTVTMTIS
jgi:hypothetical protein